VKNVKDGRIAGRSDLRQVKPTALDLVGPAAWQAMALATQQHYLAEISQKLDGIKAGVDEVLARLDDDRIGALKAMRGETNFLSILDSAKRIANITTGQEAATRIDPSKLESGSERRLADLVPLVGEQIDEMIRERDYKRALETFAAMAPELETFFDDVMVMVEDEGVRRNRIALLCSVSNAVMKIADVTKIVVDRSEYRS